MIKLIEAALPTAEVNIHTLSEKKLAPGHPANLHLWWGRSPIGSARTALAASLIDAPESVDALKSLLTRAVNGELPEFGEKPTVFDPFCGYGGIPLAAQELGLPAIASDLNPAAVLLTKAAAEIPAMFANRRPVHPGALDGQYRGTEGLAADAAYYGRLLREKAWEKLKGLYPNEPDGTPSAWIWVRTVKCPNPACGCVMPLAGSYLLYSVGKTDVWAEPVPREGGVEFVIREGQCPEEAKSGRLAPQGAVFRCPCCGSLTTDEYVRQAGQRREIGSQMMAVVLERENGTAYLAPSDAQLRAAAVPIPEDIPPGEMPAHTQHFTPAGYGFTNYTDLFTPRQLTLLTTLCDLLPEIQYKAASDALAAGMSESGGPLASGGTGAFAYGQAVGVCLALAVDRLTDTNSACCTWREKRRSYRSTFGRQVIPMAWTFAEGNPFFGTTRNFDFIVKSVAESIRKLSCGSEVRVSQQDARTAAFPKNVLVCTELPYYKKIAYAQLSDFFYIWLRKSLKPVYPELFNPMVTNKDELSTCCQDAQAYEAQMREVLVRLAQCADGNYPQLFFFEFHKADEAALANESAAAPTPWETLIGSMLHAGYEVTAVWPMRSAAASESADGIRVLIVTRVRERSEQTTRRNFAAELKKEFPAVFERMLCAGVDASDEKIVGIGAGLSLFTRYKKVLNASGTEMDIHDALTLIYRETIGFLTQREAAGEPDAADSEEV